jgi:hypothetical protein
MIIIIVLYIRWCVGQQQVSSPPAYPGPASLMILRSGAWLLYRAQLSFSIMFLSSLPSTCLLGSIAVHAVLVIDWGCFRRTCPIHLHRHLVMMVPMSSCLHLSLRSSFVIFSSQNILSIRQRHVVWEDRNLESSVSVILQHSDPNRRARV